MKIYLFKIEPEGDPPEVSVHYMLYVISLHNNLTYLINIYYIPVIKQSIW